MNTVAPAAPSTIEEKFPADRFVTLPDQVIFAEHTTRLKNGQQVVYDRSVLEQIAANCNRRIQETGNYAAVCIGHTEGSGPAKPLIGFAGPFRVQQHQNRWVITADLHIFKDQVEQLKYYPRPSPEVWVPSDAFDPDRIFLDPIAFLGAETPRLDLGMTFLYCAQTAEGWMCEKYAAVFPSPGSVQVPSFDSSKTHKTTYQKGSNMAQLAPEDIQAILKAIEATDWYQWIRQQMAASTPEKKEEGGETKPPETEGKKESYENENKSEEDNQDKEGKNSEDQEGKKEGAPKKTEEYRCTTHYRKESDMAIQKEIYQLRQALEQERALRINTERRQALEALARHYALDMEEEMALCQYGKMDDPTFQAHLARIERFYRALPVDMTLPSWAEGDAGGPGSKETYQKKQKEDLSNQARQLVERMANRGQWISYDEALERVQQGKT